MKIEMLVKAEPGEVVAVKIRPYGRNKVSCISQEQLKEILKKAKKEGEKDDDGNI